MVHYPDEPGANPRRERETGSLKRIDTTIEWDEKELVRQEYTKELFIGGIVNE
jgi:hypothetical protein